MIKAFGVLFNFYPEEYDRIINNLITEKQKGYSCVIDGNVLTTARKNPKYMDILNNAIINTCDGSTIAVLAGKIHGKEYETYNGPEIFSKYIVKPYKQVVLGNTEEIFNQLKAKLEVDGYNVDLTHLPVPFKAVEDFDYPAIAAELNEIKPDIVWVSLGAPKQEQFMGMLFPYMSQSVLFGIGAAVNLYLQGDITAKVEVGGFRSIWLERIFQEPKKQIRRIWNFAKIIPGMYLEEKRLMKK